jgi:hypothetical protein
MLPACSLPFTVRTNFLERTSEFRNSPLNFAPVSFKLGFAWTAKTYSPYSNRPARPNLPRKMSPLLRQTRQPILVLGQTHLKSTFLGSGVLGKNIEHKSSSIKNAYLVPKKSLQLALVAWRKLVIKNDQVDVKLIGPGLDFQQLAAPDKGRRIWRPQSLECLSNDFDAKRICESAQFIKGLFNAH